ncbi:uncharacterized transporter [[Candida] railenensis]|uniref:Uncharacterized transporter n=1 Tax=[Candida] railenensis TaxID=45579 RepID=A0A9P0VX87_9ASCO|nr:uncharacterized transporter [[Candida] railenensis]
MADESLYISTNEAALAVVATAMKKARLSLDTLIINSFVAGILFTAGGMIHVHVQGGSPSVYEGDPALINLIQGLVYPLGLFYVVVLGVDLFNSNILYFIVGYARGAVSLVDLLISWFISWFGNLVGTIFVCYIICNYSDVTRQTLYVQGSVDIAVDKVSYTFVQTMLKGMAGNFFVCLAIYLQLMAKPLHVKFLLMVLPVFTFVTMGFTHSVADMYMMIIGLINGAPVSVGKVIWKVFIPATIGNIIGGSFFGLLIPWYLHIVVVEKDIRLLKLPRYEYRDEQPELNQDSRVVRVKSGGPEDVVEGEEGEDGDDGFVEDQQRGEGQQELRGIMEDKEESSGAESPPASQYPPPQGITRNESFSNLSTTPSRMSAYSRYSNYRRRSREVKSPKNVFPVYGMGAPLERERSIVYGRTDNSSGDETNQRRRSTDLDEQSISSYRTANRELRTRGSAEFLGARLKKVMSRKQTEKPNDLEQQLPSRRPTIRQSSMSSSISRYLGRNSHSSRKDSLKASNKEELEEKIERAGITPLAAEASDGAAGVSEFFMGRDLEYNTNIANTVDEGISPTDEVSHFGPNLDATKENDTVPNSTNDSFNIVNYNPTESKE